MINNDVFYKNIVNYSNCQSDENPFHLPLERDKNSTNFINDLECFYEKYKNALGDDVAEIIRV